jgi:ABC-type glutathione transport system ATPase component
LFTSWYNRSLKKIQGKLYERTASKATHIVGALLQTHNLTVVFAPAGEERVIALNAVSLKVSSGEVLGVLGESGSGKTTLGLSLLSLLPETGSMSGSIRYRGRELLGLKERQLQRIRGAEISIIFQEPILALHPTLCVGEQVADVIRAHRGSSRRDCREAAERALAKVHLEDARRIYAAYPHELSGGERQRVAIARAIASQPSLLVADEPTASLDSTLRAEILGVLRELNERLGVAILFISHNPAELVSLAHRVVVISFGQIVEQGPLGEVLERPVHAYTRSLLQEIPGRPN